MKEVKKKKCERNTETKTNDLLSISQGVIQGRNLREKKIEEEQAKNLQSKY